MPSHRAAGLVAGLLWLASLWLPAISLAARHADMDLQAFEQNGWWLLTAGWVGIFSGQPAWLANLLVIGLVPTLLMGKQPPWWVSLACAALSLLSLALPGTTIHFDGGPYRVVAFDIGYWLWLLAAQIPALLMLTELNVRRRAK
ncbi:MAG: hypothetical protein EOP60_15880 [Sphingomonadales bacterium]|nr:MAG: hypothetical protein EOP60_15880 [Sphingomonadales bacterium]